ncbi:hypothetical protein ACFX19_021566 [Malus domestica]
MRFSLGNHGYRSMFCHFKGITESYFKLDEVIVLKVFEFSLIGDGEKLHLWICKNFDTTCDHEKSLCMHSLNATLAIQEVLLQPCPLMSLTLQWSLPLPAVIQVAIAILLWV